MAGFRADPLDKRPLLDGGAGTNATIRTIGGSVGKVKSLGITWQPRSGTNCIHLARRFAPTWHPELRRSTRGGGRSRMTWSPRSPYEGNLTVAAHGSEPLTPTAGVKNRYSVLARRRFSPARLAKTPTLGNCARVDSQWVGTSPFAAERARRGEPAPSSPAQEARWAPIGIRHDPRLRDRIFRRIGEPAQADRRMRGFANAGTGVSGFGEADIAATVGDGTLHRPRSGISAKCPH